MNATATRASRLEINDITTEAINKNDISNISKEIARKQKEKKLKEHIQKPLHGKYFNTIQENNLSKQMTFGFLKPAGLKSETEGFIIAAQDGVIETLAYRKKILKQNINDINCRACHTNMETQFHLISNCPVYAKTFYLERHNAALRELYAHLRHKLNFDEERKPAYTLGKIEAIISNEKGTIFWNHPFATTRQLSANKPDLAVLLKQQKQLVVVEFTCPDENNIPTKYLEKRNKYRDLLFELQKTYDGCKVKLVILIIGALGGMPNDFIRNLQEKPHCEKDAKYISTTMQKSVILGSLRILRAHGIQFPNT